MSPEYGRDTVAFHFTWQPDQPPVEALLVDLDAALGPVRCPPTLGQALRGESGRNWQAVRASARLHPPGRAPRPARGVPQHVVRSPGAGLGMISGVALTLTLLWRAPVCTSCTTVI